MPSAMCEAPCCALSSSRMSSMGFFQSFLATATGVNPCGAFVLAGFFIHPPKSTYDYRYSLMAEYSATGDHIRATEILSVPVKGTLRSALWMDAAPLALADLALEETGKLNLAETSNPYYFSACFPYTTWTLQENCCCVYGQFSFKTNSCSDKQKHPLEPKRLLQNLEKNEHDNMNRNRVQTNYPILPICL